MQFLFRVALINFFHPVPLHIFFLPSETAFFTTISSRSYSFDYPFGWICGSFKRTYCRSIRKASPLSAVCDQGYENIVGQTGINCGIFGRFPSDTATFIGNASFYSRWDTTEGIFDDEHQYSTWLK